jgi:hypothetical protein
MNNLKCKDKVKEAFEGRMEDIRTLYNAEENETEELGSLSNYGLCIDKVEAGTFEGQRANYIRYQLSHGGPTEEFRLYENGDLEFWFLDWFDGACIDVEEEDADIIKEIIGWADIRF